MQAFPDGFETAMTDGAPVYQRLTVSRGSTVVADNLPLESGSIDLDGSAETRRTIRARLGDEYGTLRPRLASDPLAPFGTILRARVGYYRPDGTVADVPVGTFTLDEPSWDSLGAVDVAGSDLSVIIADALFERPHVIPAGTNLGTAIYQIIDSRLPGQLEFVPAGFAGVTSSTVPLIVLEEGDSNGNPWTNALDLARADGLELFFDALGRPTLRTPADPSSAAPTYSYVPGTLVTGSAGRIPGRAAKNVAIASGEGSGNASPVRASAEITDASHPLHPNNIGRRPVFFVSPLITTGTQAGWAAYGTLQRVASVEEIVSFSAVPNPAHEPGDVVHLESPAAGIDVKVVLERWSLDLLLASESAYECRSGRRVA